MNQALARSLESGAPHDWERFIRAAHPTVASGVMCALARWSHPEPADVDSLVETAFLELCAGNCEGLKRFQTECPEALPAYLRAVASAVSCDFVRSLPARATVSEQSERSILLGRLDRCLRTQPDRDRWAFWFYYRHGLPLEAISHLLHVTVREADQAIDRMTEAAVEEWSDRTYSLRACDPGPLEPSCLGVHEIACIAAGAALPDAAELFDHIADCDRCGGLLRDAWPAGAESSVEGLRTASAGWRSEMARRWSREARTGSPRYWLPAAAASLARRWMHSRGAAPARPVRSAGPSSEDSGGPVGR